MFRQQSLSLGKLDSWSPTMYATTFLDSMGSSYLSGRHKPLALRSLRAWHFICMGILATTVLQLCILKFWLSPHQMQPEQAATMLRQHVLKRGPALQWAQAATLGIAVTPQEQYGGLEPRLLVVHVQHGLANRLRAMLWGWALADITARRYVVIWDSDMHCNAKFEDLFQYPLIDPFTVWDSLPRDLLDSEFDVYNYMEPEPGAKKYQYIDTDSSRNIYIRTAYTLNCTEGVRPDIHIPNLFARLHPSPAVRAIVQAPAATSAQYDYVGVHVRHTNAKQDIDSRLPKQVYTDKNWSLLRDARALSKPSTFLLECKRILAQSPNLRVFVAADLEETATDFVKELGSAVFYIRKPGCTSGVRSKRCVQFALADILMLSNSRFLLGSYWSSFTEVASYARQLAVRYAGVDFYGPYEDVPITCAREDWVHPNAFHGVTIFNAVCSRNEMLARNLPSWLNVTGVDEILILDWNSTPPVEEITKPLNSRKIKVVRVTSTTIGFWMTVAYNLAALHARGGRILKVDADLELPHDLVTRLPYLPPGSFYAGNWRTAPTLEESHLNGLVFVHRSDLARVNGYDERLVKYGFDDENIYARLKAAGVRRVDADLSGVKHMAHSDSSRTKLFLQTGPQLDPHASTILNELLLNKVRPWGPDDSHARLACNQTSSEVCDCAMVETPPFLHDLVPAAELDRLVVLTKRIEVVSVTKWTWDQVLSIDSSEWLDHYFSMVGTKERRELILQPLGCLADRLQTVTAAIALAQLWDRPLTVVWVLDQFCTTQLEDFVPNVAERFQLVHIFKPWEADEEVFELVDFVASPYAALPFNPDNSKHMLVRTAGSAASAALERALGGVNPEALPLAPGVELPTSCAEYPVLKIELDGPLATQLRGLTDLWTLSEALNRPLIFSHKTPSKPSINEFVASRFSFITEGSDWGVSDNRTYRAISGQELEYNVDSSDNLLLSYEGYLSTPLIHREHAARVAQRLTLRESAQLELTRFQAQINVTMFLGAKSWDTVKECFYGIAAEAEMDPSIPVLVVAQSQELCEHIPAAFSCFVVPSYESESRDSVRKLVAALFLMGDSTRLFWDSWTFEVEWAVLRGDMPNHELKCKTSRRS